MSTTESVRRLSSPTWQALAKTCSISPSCKLGWQRAQVRQNLDLVKTGGAIIATGLVVAVSASPVGLVGIAELLVSEMGLKRGYAAFDRVHHRNSLSRRSGGIGGMGVWRKRIGFPLSGEELARNVNWVRTVLRQSGRLSFRR